MRKSEGRDHGQDYRKEREVGLRESIQVRQPEPLIVALPPSLIAERF